MKIKHIYINKEGEPTANPEMALPLHFKEEFDYTQDDIEDYSDAMKQYHSGLLPFEDRDKIEFEILSDVDAHVFKLQPDTLIPVDLEVEVVEQWLNPNTNTWESTGRFGYKYRKVLRIKP